MEELMVRIEGQVARLARRKEELVRENAVLRRENDRIRERLSAVSGERDTFEKRLKLGTRRVEQAIGRLNLLSEDG